VIISCQENRSFDHYFGYAPQVQAAGFGPPPGYSQPDGTGGTVAPYEFTSLSTPDIGHSWSAVHGEWDAGAMDGIFTTDGINAMGYYTAAELPFYYSLFADSALCANYHCSLLGPTWPNRFYFAAGTSGGITTNGVWGYGVFDYPIILDLLDAAGITWKIYNLGWDSVPFGNTDNVFVFWQRWAHDQRTRGSKGDYLNDLRLGRLPQVSFIVPSYARGWDEHPPADVLFERDRLHGDPALERVGGDAVGVKRPPARELVGEERECLGHRTAHNHALSHRPGRVDVSLHLKISLRVSQCLP